MSVTSSPRCLADAATSEPIQPAPTTTTAPPRSSRARRASESSTLRRYMTPSSSLPGIVSRRGSAPVASSRRS